MDSSKWQHVSRLIRRTKLNSITCKCVGLIVFGLLVRALFMSSFTGLDWNVISKSLLNESSGGIDRIKFLEVPQIAWGLNNQKIAFVRACLTARMLNRTLLMPSLSASLFYKEVDLLQPIPFDKVFDFDRFNSLCEGFVQLSRFPNRTMNVTELHKGSGRKWTVEKDLDQLRQFSKEPYDSHDVVRIVGKNPFLWHDHWAVKDYAKVFQCLFFVEEISKEADSVVSKIREMGRGSLETGLVPYVAVHMRIEKDWMIHCKKLEQRSNITEICSSKEEIMERVSNIAGLKAPVVIYLAIADSLLEDKSILNGWKKGLIPFEKKKLGVLEIYKNKPYLIQSAIDYEVCSRADVFVGNSFSTFSSLIVLERTLKMMKMGVTSSCESNVRWPSYAYNIRGESNGPHVWMTNMSASSLQAISYGSNHISCRSIPL
ncbi:O-fucosyltransferase 23 [Impatiens glandulifera]|uniref:O-fucosyltransferase 23 n=1 Tax=Impatiens glandulifera TaxID=253017 RepID=UPI001FB16E32|nr:O-fucosyltransferase 23 [Impatiens glandulifera]